MRFVDSADQPLVETTLARLTPDNPVTSIEHRYVTPTGDVHWQQWVNRLIVDERGRTTELQGVGRDITERKLAEDVLQKSLAREIELGELRSRFVSMVSHEFRTPLAIISMNCDILQKYYDVLTPDQQTEQFDNIFESIRRMIELLDDVLTISRAESGQLEFAPTAFDVAELCRTIIDDIQTTLGAGLIFQVDVSGVCSDVVLDKKLVQLILSNLISNAARYTPAGRHVTVELDCGPAEVIFRVRDEGIGIPPAAQRRIFEPFYRAENVEAITGTGLGLAIAHQCVEQHGGTITFESQVNSGTTFTVRLPIISPARRQPATGRR
jgi:signal transduction histidine kinase